MRLSQLLVGMALLSLTACTSAHQSQPSTAPSTAPDAPESSPLASLESAAPASVASETLPAPRTCPENSASNDYPPDQVRPTTADLGVVIGFHIGVWPEGPNVDVGDPTIMKPTPAMMAAFEQAKKQVPNPIPALLPQPCCGGGAILYIRFASGHTAAYGPCARPPVIEEIVNLLFDAYSNQ